MPAGITFDEIKQADFVPDRSGSLVAAANEDFELVDWAVRRPPYYLLDAWRDYVHEHCRRKGQEVRRVVYIARDWLRVMGIA